MRVLNAGAALAALLVLSACSQPQASLDTDDQKASYAYGLDVGNNFSPAADLLDVAAFVQGFRDALNEAEPALDQAEIAQVMQSFSERVRESQMAQREVQAETNQAEGAAYLEENSAREGVSTTDSGLQYEVLEAADGSMPGPDDQVRIHYRGTLIDGTEFDSSYSRGEPAVFGVGGVIPGFSEGLQLMPVGSKYRFVIPSDLGYGAQGTGGDIGPDATLIFEVEMLEIVES